MLSAALNPLRSAARMRDCRYVSSSTDSVMFLIDTASRFQRITVARLLMLPAVSPNVARIAGRPGCPRVRASGTPAGSPPAYPLPPAPREHARRRSAWSRMIGFPPKTSARTVTRPSSSASSFMVFSYREGCSLPIESGRCLVLSRHPFSCARPLELCLKFTEVRSRTCVANVVHNVPGSDRSDLGQPRRRVAPRLSCR